MNQGNTIEELSTISQRIKSQKNIIEGLGKFSLISTVPNQNIHKMIEYQHQDPQKKPSVVSYKNSQSLAQKQSSHLVISQKERKKYELQRKIPVKQDLGFFGNIMKCLLFAFIVIFLVDFYYEIQNEIQLRTNEIAKCYQDYHENKQFFFLIHSCQFPLDALVQECNRLQFCASRDPKSVLKISNVFIKTVAGLIKMVTQHLQLTGMIFVIVLLLVYFNRPTMYQEEKVSKYQ